MSSYTESDAPAPDEPVTITDRRRIDPDTGAMRQADSVAGDTLGDCVNSDTQGAFSPEAQSKIDELTADLQRAQADFVNYKRRVERDHLGVIEAARAASLNGLLIVLDDLDRAREHGDLDSGPMKAVADKLSGALTSQGLLAFGEAGDDFDPALHEAVHNDAGGADLVVGNVLRKGYRFGERILRTALVSVIDRIPDDSVVTDGDT